MKKLITAALALTLVLSMSSVPAFAATVTSVTSGSNTDSKNVIANYNPTKTDTYSVDITWGDMSFNYTPTTHDWNAETLKYDDSVTGTWTPTATDANKITVTNNSNASVAAGLSYNSAASYTAVDGVFKNADSNAVTALALASSDNGGATGIGTAQTTSAWLNLSSTNFTGKALTDTQIGTVTVTITSD